MYMLFFNTLALAFSSSIDSFGIGITYGLKKTKLSFSSKLILFFISIITTLFSGVLGFILKHILSKKIVELLGSLILIGIGIFIIIETSNTEYSFDFDNSNDINNKEALALGLALSLDSLCIGIGVSAIGINIFIFSMVVALLQYIYLNLGHFLGVHLSNFSIVSQSVWTKISGSLMIFIGLLKLFF